MITQFKGYHSEVIMIKGDSPKEWDLLRGMKGETRLNSRMLAGALKSLRASIDAMDEMLGSDSQPAGHAKEAEEIIGRMLDDLTMREINSGVGVAVRDEDLVDAFWHLREASQKLIEAEIPVSAEFHVQGPLDEAKGIYYTAIEEGGASKMLDEKLSERRRE